MCICISKEERKARITKSYTTGIHHALSRSPPKFYIVPLKVAISHFRCGLSKYILLITYLLGK